MKDKIKISVFWFRRDLRLNDNIGLTNALKLNFPVLPIFIFDSTILKGLSTDDVRITFIYNQLENLSNELKRFNSDIRIEYGEPIKIWQKLAEEYFIDKVIFNRDYEPYALKRDRNVTDFLISKNIDVLSFKDHVFFEKDEIVKDDGSPYTVFTPYKKKWLEKFKSLPSYKPQTLEIVGKNFTQIQFKKLTLIEIGFVKSKIENPEINLSVVDSYQHFRDIPYKNATSHAGHHLRFGTMSIRSLVYYTKSKNEIFLSELIWRDFFSQILFHFPKVVNESFKKKYDFIEWENDPELFEKWCKGETGYPIVDAGMKQLNETGFMHNRVRMIVASFLVKHLLIDWRWGEAYFAEKLLDYDLASNNGNWQWAAGCGCDAAPYFRVFNPTVQQEKFDPDFKYVRTWIPGFDPENYITPIVEHKFARDRIIQRFKNALM